MNRKQHGRVLSYSDRQLYKLLSFEAHPRKIQMVEIIVLLQKFYEIINELIGISHIIWSILYDGISRGTGVFKEQSVVAQI